MIRNLAEADYQLEMLEDIATDTDRENNYYPHPVTRFFSFIPDLFISHDWEKGDSGDPGDDETDAQKAHRRARADAEKAMVENARERLDFVKSQLLNSNGLTAYPAMGKLEKLILNRIQKKAAEKQVEISAVSVYQDAKIMVEGKNLTEIGKGTAKLVVPGNKDASKLELVAGPSVLPNEQNESAIYASDGLKSRLKNGNYFFTYELTGGKKGSFKFTITGREEGDKNKLVEYINMPRDSNGAITKISVSDKVDTGKAMSIIDNALKPSGKSAFDVNIKREN